MSTGRGSSKDSQDLSHSAVPRRITVTDSAGDRPGGPDGRGTARRLEPLPADSPHLVAEESEEGRVRPGFELGNKKAHATDADAGAQKASQRKLIIAVAVGILLILVLMMLLTPAGGKNGVLLTDGDQVMLRDYKDYLIRHNQHPRGEDIETHLKEIEGHLKTYRWAVAVGEKGQAEHESDTLLLMDKDRNSPLYIYCVKNLSGK